MASLNQDAKETKAKLKRFKDLYRQVYDFENLYLAYREARKSKRYRDEVLRFSANLESNLIQLQNELIWKQYKVSRYREFYVYDPKKRLIMALPFRDRVVQWAIYRVINPLLDRQFIYDSYACRVGKGTHKAADRLQYWLRYLDRRYSKVYVLKQDISKYFYRVDHAVLKGILRKKIADRDLLWLLDTIIDGDGQKFGIPLGDHDFEFDRLADIGMPIGNLTSQLFANLYLNEADQYAKHQLRLKYYIRYMDDILVLHPDKKYLHEVKEVLGAFLTDELHLTLNRKTGIRLANQGIDFVGYRIWPTHRRVRRRTVKKIKQRLRQMAAEYAAGLLSLEEINAVVQSYIGHLSHADTYRLRQKLFSEFVLRRGPDEEGLDIDLLLP